LDLGLWTVLLAFSPFRRFALALIPSPNDKPPVFINSYPFCANEFFLEVFYILIIQGKAPL
jgi:hypothetical protein